MGPERTIDAAQPADLLEPAETVHLDQSRFLLGHGVENPADGIHGVATGDDSDVDRRQQSPGTTSLPRPSLASCTPI